MMMMINVITRNSSGDEKAKRDFLHILASPGYAPGTIAVNVYIVIVIVKTIFNAHKVNA